VESFTGFGFSPRYYSYDRQLCCSYAKPYTHRDFSYAHTDFSTARS
jgi:hypothetical protein